MNTYLIKLTPHDKFFFGTDKEFGADNRNYFVKSGYFPQQTTLLGMLRYQLLCQAPEDIFRDNKIQNKKKAAELIGAKSFTQGENNTFGKIKSLSPVFLMQGNTKFFPLNKEYQEVSKDDKGNKEWKMCEISKDFRLLEGYNVKIGLSELWTNDENRKYELSDIFKEVEQVGIRKNYDGTTDDKAFYIQTYRKFKSSDMAFAFYVNSDIEINPSNLIFIGRERQSFSMEVEKVEAGFKVNEDLYQASQNAHKVILLSDAYFTNISDYDFAITETVGFRCLQANKYTEHYYNIRQKDESESSYNKTNLHKSKKIELYKKGSVFYFSDEQKMREFTEKLKNSEFYTIGYNHFITINKQ